MKLERLDHFGIEVCDLAHAESFYTEVLGLSVVTHLGDQVLLDCGGQNLALFHVARPPLSPAERHARISPPPRDASPRPASRAHSRSIGATTIASTSSIPTATCSRS